MASMTKYMEDTNKLGEISFKIGSRSIKISELNASIEEESGIGEADLKKAYDNAIKANALDFMRDYLPMSILTHVGISMDARSYENMFNKMLASPLSESRWIAKRLSNDMKALVPSLVKRIYDEHGTTMQKFFSDRNTNTYNALISKTKGLVSKEESVALSEYAGEGTANPDEKAQLLLAAVIIYRFSRGASMKQSMAMAKELGVQGRKKIIGTYVGKRTNRRHKPGRAFESLDYTFDLKGRIGIYRDIQRHRIGTQERQYFSTQLGYDTRQAFSDIGIVDDYKSKMDSVTELYNKLFEILPYQAQYVVTLGFNTRWYYKLNARQLFHLCELRTSHQGHPDYRKLVQDMAMKVKGVHPTVIEPMSYLDMSEKTLGRLDSEIRIAVKKSKLLGKS
jgi:thymidylate synthase ThyX